MSKKRRKERPLRRKFLSLAAWGLGAIGKPHQRKYESMLRAQREKKYKQKIQTLHGRMREEKERKRKKPTRQFESVYGGQIEFIK